MRSLDLDPCLGIVVFPRHRPVAGRGTQMCTHAGGVCAGLLCFFESTIAAVVGGFFVMHARRIVPIYPKMCISPTQLYQRCSILKVGQLCAYVTGA